MLKSKTFIQTIATLQHYCEGFALPPGAKILASSNISCKMTFPNKGYVQDTIEQPAKDQIYCFVKLHNRSEDLQMSMSGLGFKN